MANAGMEGPSIRALALQVVMGGVRPLPYLIRVSLREIFETTRRILNF